MNKLDKTREFLTEMHNAGYHKVTVGNPDPENNPACAKWPNGPYSIWGWHPSFDGYHNGPKEHSRCCRNGSWPAVWGIRDKYVESLCGNGHQAQIMSNQKVLFEGTFDIKTPEDIEAAINEIFARNL